eukprot:g3408.t1
MLTCSGTEAVPSGYGRTVRTSSTRSAGGDVVVRVTMYEVGTPLNDIAVTPYDRVIEFGDFPSVLDNDDNGRYSNNQVRSFGPGGPSVLAD